MAATFAILSDPEKEAWLVQHVPHRICAALTWLHMPSKWAMPAPPDMKPGDFHVWCIGRSVQEGHLAAMRWLIEFIGVTLDAKQGVPATPKPHPNGKSVSIREVGGSLFPLSNVGDALFLAKVWQACSQASLHPTIDTNHLELPESTLARALQLVVDHLEKNLYDPKARDLFQIVRDQERRANQGGAAANVFIRFASP